LKTEDVLTCGLSKGYCIDFDVKVEHSLLACTLGRKSSFVLPSVAIVNIDKRARVVSKPDNRKLSPVDLRGTRKALLHLEHYRRVVAALDFQAETADSLRRL